MQQRCLTSTSYLQFVYRELKLYLKISLIQERIPSLLAWDAGAVGSPLTKLIPTDVTINKKKTLWRLPALNANQTHPWSAWLAIFVCDGVAMWLKTVLKAVFSIDPHQLKALRAELGWSILLCTCLLSAGKAICCSGFFPQMINLRENHSPVVLY